MELHVQSRRSPAKRTAEQCFGQAIREHRKLGGFTQEQLAFESGYHPTYIGQLERGQKSPSLRAIMSLASVLKTHGSVILERVEDLLGEPRKKP
jgi:transcriptional regulator with XRE-family HTH domain